MSDTIITVIAIAAAAVVFMCLFFLFRIGQRPASVSMEEGIRQLTALQAELSGRLSQMAAAQAAATQALSERLHAQERTVSKVLEDRLAEVARRVGDGLQVTTEKTFSHMNDLRERLAVIDAAQKNILDLSTQIVSLQDILSNKQARGAFGEQQLNTLVVSILPPSIYKFQALLSNNRCVDCLLSLPNPPGSIAIDAKFPLESYRRLCAASDSQARQEAGRDFTRDVTKHVRDIAERYILPGETAESALMFLPSEAVYAELHANFPEVVEKSYQSKVWIVSPTTLMATLNTIRAVLKDAHIHEQAKTLQSEIGKLTENIMRLDDRVGNLAKHFNQAQEDIRQIQISSGKVSQHMERIESLQLDESGNVLSQGGAISSGHRAI